jgi:hypothetical protein
MIGFEGLEAAVAASKGIFAKLQSVYPDMRAYLVLVHHGQQTELTSNPIQILDDCDQMVATDGAKRDALRLISEMKRLESAGANQKAVQEISRKLTARGRGLQFLPEIQIEIRFHTLRYALVWALQSEPLIDLGLTPQTKASIRIVLGTLDRLSRIIRTPES